MIIRFTIEACARNRSRAEGKGFEPSSRQAGTALAERPGQPYPATFHSQWTHRESNPDFQTASLMSSLWTMSPLLFSGPAGESNPDLLVASQASFRWTSSPCRGPSGIRTRPSSLPRRCAAENTYRPK